MDRERTSCVDVGMIRSLALLALLGCVPACLTVRGGVGPTTAETKVGMDATFTVGAGNDLGEDRGWYVGSEFGFALAPVEKEPGLTMHLVADYVSVAEVPDRGTGLSWRAGPRFGARPVFGDEEDGTAVTYVTVGGAIAVFPWTWAGKKSYRSDDKMGDLFGLGRLRGYYGLGFEVAGERLLSDEADDAWLIRFALVFDMSTLPD